MLPLALGAAPAAASTGPTPEIETTITAGPAEGSTIEEAEPTFAFTASIGGVPMPGAVFQCAVDGEPASECASPFRLPAIEEEGQHSFSVYAEDPLSLSRDSTPAIRDFSFDRAEEADGEEECDADGEAEEELEEAGEFEAEEGEGCEAQGDGAPPAECLLRSASTRLTASPAHERVRLVVRYTSYAPTDVEVGYRVGGTHGAPRLGEVRAHFAKRGVFKDTERLSRAEEVRVRAARRFTVDLEVPAVPASCRRYELRHLTVRRSAHGRAVWLQSDSPFGLDG